MYKLNALLISFHWLIMDASSETSITLKILMTEGEKNHKKGGLNCVFGNFFFNVLDDCPQVQSLK